MNGKMMAILTIAILGIVTVPVSMDGYEGSVTTVSMCDKYLCVTTVDWDPQYRLDDNYYYFNVGSANDLLMDKYVEDQKVPVLRDDRENLSGKVHIYLQSTYPTTNIAIWNGSWDRVQTLFCSTAVEPFNNSFFVKAGDTFRIQVFNIKDRYGTAARAQIRDANYEYHDLDQEYVETSNKSKEINIEIMPRGTENSLLPYYYTAIYEASGYSEPNGSATMFIAICAMVTIIALGLLILSGMKPKWSK